MTAYHCNPAIADQEFLFSKRQYTALTGCKDFDSFLAALKTAGVEVKRGKYLTFTIPSGKKFIRCSSLGEDYTEDAILERISGKRIITPKQKQAAPNLLIDIQAKLQQAYSPGFERWASVFNLKEMAKTLNFLQEHGLVAYADLESACDAATKKHHDFADHTKANSEKMTEISELQKYIGAYGKTREIYVQYRKLPPKNQEEFYAEHASAIISCEAAKRFFDSLGLKKLPFVQSLKQEYAALLAENKRLYPEQKKAKAEMMELLTARHNIARIWGLTDSRGSRRRRRLKRSGAMRRSLQGLGAVSHQQANGSVYTEPLLTTMVKAPTGREISPLFSSHYLSYNGREPD